MNVLLKSIPRVDGLDGDIRVGSLDLDGVAIRSDGINITHIDGLGAEMGGNSKKLIRQVAECFRRHSPDADPKKAQDAAEKVVKDGIGRLFGATQRRAAANPVQQLAKALASAMKQDGATDFVSSELELVMGESETVIRPADPTLFVPGPGRTLVLPNRNLLRPGLRTNSYKVRQRRGQAQWADPNTVGRQINRAGFDDEKVVRGAEYYAIQYGYSIPGEWEAGYLGIDILGENQMAAVEAMEDFRERVSTWGDAEKAVAGFATLSDAVIISAGQQFNSLTPTAEQMMQRLAAIEQRYMLANQDRRPTNLLAPNADRLAMQNTYFTGTSDSVWSKAVEQYPWVRDAVWTDRLMLASADSTAARWIVYSQDPKNLYIEHMDHMLFGPFQEFMTFTFVLLARHGGVVSKIPERVVYVDFTA